MNTTTRYLVIIAVAAVATAAAATFYHSYTITRTQFLNTAAARNAVTGFGDELQSVSLLAPAASVADAMDKHYALYIESDLLAKWKANPATALGRVTSSPWPDRIEITDTQKNADGSYAITGNIIEVANGAQGKQTVNSTPVRFTVIFVGDGWQISGYQKL